jgi:hypothetical protein
LSNTDTKIYSEAEVLEIVRKIRALQDLSKSTGTITTRTQSHILRALPEDVLTRVSLVLADGGAR